MTTKICTTCKQEKTLIEFHKNKTKPDGYMYSCKICENERISKTSRKRIRIRNTDEQKSKNREYVKRHRAKKEKIVTKKIVTKKYINHKEKRMFYKFGIKMEQFNSMLEKQGHKCVICSINISEYISNSKKVFAIDHCHKTGKIRGLLCSKCNTLLGMANDNPEILRNAIKYLKGSI